MVLKTSFPDPLWFLFKIPDKKSPVYIQGFSENSRKKSCRKKMLFRVWYTGFCCTGIVVQYCHRVATENLDWGSGAAGDSGRNLLSTGSIWMTDYKKRGWKPGKPEFRKGQVFCKVLFFWLKNFQKIELESRYFNLKISFTKVFKEFLNYLPLLFKIKFPLVML